MSYYLGHEDLIASESKTFICPDFVNQKIIILVLFRFYLEILL